MKKKDYKKAAQIYMKVMGLSTRYYATATQLGEHMLVKGYKSEALELFGRVVSRSRRNAALRARIIDTCMANHEYEFVTNIMERTLKDNPSNYDLLYKTGLVHQETGNLERALECFRTVDSHRKGDVNAKLQIARIHYINRQVIKADDYLSQVLRLDPGKRGCPVLKTGTISFYPPKPTWLMAEAIVPAPKPLSIFTTAMFETTGVEHA